MVSVYLCRHGETEENAAGILQGQLPGHLSAEGRRQAAELGQQLSQLKADVVVCSDLQRTIDTTAIALGTDCQPVLEPLLRERDWGRFTGRPIQQALVEGANCPDTPTEGAPESVEDMMRRAATLIDKWRQQYEGRTLIAIGHGLFNRALIAAAQGCTLREVPRYGNAELRLLSIDRAPVTVLSQQEIKATAN